MSDFQKELPPPFAHGARARLEALKAARWPAEGREERIRLAREAWDRTPPLTGLDPATIKRIAEDPDLEHDE